MRRLKLTRTTWIVTIALVMLAGAYITALLVAKQYYEPPSPDASTYSSAPGGAKALYLYLARLGHRVDRLEEFERVPPNARTVVLITPLVRYPNKTDAKMMRRWVGEGGRLVLVGPIGTTLHSSFGIAFSHIASKSSTARPSQPGALVRDISGVRLRGTSRLVGPDAAVTYLADSDGPVVQLFRFGRGTVITLSDSYPVSNAGIGSGDGYALASNLVGSARGYVLFDEYHHGFSVAPGPLGILAASSRYGLIALVIACVIFLYAWGKRLGPAVTCEPDAQRSATEYAASLGGLFESAGARTEALKMLAAGLERRAGRRVAVHGEELDATRALAARLGKRVEQGDMTPEEFYELGSQVYDARMGVEAVGRRRRRKEAM